MTLSHLSSLSTSLSTLFSDARFENMTRESVENLIVALQNALECKASQDTARWIADVLSEYRPIEGCHEDLFEALIELPEWVVKEMPRYIISERLPATRESIFYLGKEVMYSTYLVISGLEAVLSNPLPDENSEQYFDGRRLQAALDTIRCFGLSPTSRQAPDWRAETRCETNSEATRAYQEYVIMMLEGDGGKCRY